MTTVQLRLGTAPDRFTAWLQAELSDRLPHV
jgi:hypothetical protein